MRNKKSSMSGLKCNIGKGLSSLIRGGWGCALERFCYINH